MARRRKETSKSKSSVRKTMDNANAVDGDNKLKDDPGGGQPQAMDEIKYLSNITSQANNPTEISQQNQIHDNHHHHKYNNSNTHVSDLKYLHKKFKRIASATVVDNINTPVIDSRPINEVKLNSSSQPEIVGQGDVHHLNNISKDEQQFHRLKTDQETVDEKSEVVVPQKTLHQENPKHFHPTTATVLNGFSYSYTNNNSRSIEAVNNLNEISKFNANGSPIIAASNEKFNNFAQTDVANLINSHKQSANAIISNSSSISSVNTTKTYFIPVETALKNQDGVKTSPLEINQQRLDSYTPPTVNYQQTLMGKSTFNNYPLKTPTHHYQSIGDVVRPTTSTLNSISIIQAPNQSKMQYQQTHPEASQTPGRYVCPYCQLNCTKPSVLQKHIRAHTNERPYPCDVCDFAFKTRSNLYKHCRSRAHALRTQGVEPQPDDEASLGGSDQDQDQELSSSASSDVISGTASPTEDRVSSPSSHQIEKPYKPKFHNAALYTAEDQQKQKFAQQHQQPQSQQQLQPTTSTITTPGAISISHPLSTQNVEYLKERISKIISENETIVEGVEAPLKKKYRKITGISRGASVNETPSTKLTMALLKREREESQNNANNNVTTASVQQSTTSTTVTSSQTVRPTLPTLQQQAQQVLQSSQQFSLNLTQIFDANENQRKRRFSEGIGISQEVATHPQNPERSIIKDLLLNSRGLAVPTGEGDEAVYTCPLCKITFRRADNLQYHTQCYCQGSPASTPQSAPISPVGSPSHKYLRSNSFNVNLPERYNPNTLAKLASSTLRHPSKTPLSLAKLAQTKIKPGRSKPENIVINKDTCPAPTPLPTQSISVQCAPIAKLIDAPLPSPGPLLGKTRLVDTYNGDRMTEEAIVSHFTSERDSSAQAYNIKSFPADREKRSRVDSYSMNSPVFLTSMEQLASPNSRLLQMCGGDLKIVERREETVPKFGSSGGSIVSISPPSDCHTPEPFSIRSGLLSGGGVVDSDVNSTTGYATPTLTPKHGQLSGQYFQFPPISPIITGYNPLTLPPVHATTIVHGGRIIPHVPGIPGPSSLSPRPVSPLKRIPSPSNRRMVPSPLTLSSSNAIMTNTNSATPKFTVQTNSQVNKSLVARTIPNIKIDDSDEKSKKIGRNGINESNLISPITSAKPDTKRSFNFSRIAENLSPRNDMKKNIQEPIDADVRYFNFDNLVTKPEIKSSHTSPLHIDVSTAPNLQIIRLEETTTINEPVKSTKFLRPSSLPLKPGTFTPKRHHGITPTANTLPLISPETPRPSKSCVQLYLNGHAYTYLGLKCSTKTFYCTVNRPQPVHFTNQHKLSIYSNWQICAESDPHPLGLSPKNAMSLYDSRQRPSMPYTMAKQSQTCTTLHSQSLIVTPFDNNKLLSTNDNSSANRNAATSKSEASVPAVSGGYESNENYTYVRGRGRGRYVCSECGIRCKKPSMLKKHIRTHSDVRPYTCQHCLFSFKTKGNLTKHMKSKAHYKKCEELGLTPLPPSTDDDGADDDMEGSSMTSGDHTSTVPGDSDTDDLTDGEDGENDSSDTSDSKMRLPEHEAARCLLYLSQTPPGNTSMPNLIPVRPMTYPYGDQPSQIFTQPTSDPPSARRVISFQTATPFESPKHDQYYANPKVSVMSQKFEDSNSMPIDLTKPRDTQQVVQQTHSSMQQNSNEVDGIILKGPAGFLTTLVSNTDKLQTRHQVISPLVDENIFMQTYLTERALQDTKIKQSQMYRHVVTSTINTTTSSVVSKISLMDMESRRTSLPTSFDKQTFTINTITVSTSSTVSSSSEKKIHPTMSTAVALQTKPLPVVEKVIANSQNGCSREFEKIVSVESRFDRNDDNTSGMDTLAEIAASSVKLDITQTRIKVVDAENLNVPSSQQANSAKSVASEYLKMTSAEFMKAHQYKSDREESDESESEDEGGPIKPPEFAGVLARKFVGDDNFKGNAPDFNVVQLIQEDGRSACSICHKTFPKPSQVKLHMNIHYMERKFRCEPCAVSFRTQGHLQKHERSEQHKNKVLMTSTFGNVTTSNPRPFECSDCNIAFRIHGHLAKHLRSKTHVQKLECLQKLPFGTYAEIERAGISLTDIDTTDCHNSLASLKLLAQRLLDKDPSKLSGWTHGDEQHVRNFTNESRESNSDGEPICSPDDESIGDGRISDREIGGGGMSDGSVVSGSVKRKSEMNGIFELNESGVENHEKRLKIFSDT